MATALALTAGLLGGCASGGGFDVRPLSSQQSTGNTTDLRLAESALSSGNTELAGTLFERALTASPKSIEAQIGLGDTLYQAGDLERARVLYTQAARQAPAQPGPQLGLARVALRQRRLDDAVGLYRVLLDSQPENTLAAEGLGTALDLQGHHTQAQAVYRRALQAHPEVQGLRVDLGLSLILSNKPREGANVLLDITGLSSAPLQARQNLALAYGLLGNADAAKKILLADLPASSVDDNLRFYERVRAKLAARTVDGGDTPTGAGAAQARPGAAQ
ncbi:hypothetical protein GCM10027419_10140 [Pandoraea terrae]